MRLLVLGANGLLGSNVVASGVARDWEVLGTFHSEAPAIDVPLSQLDLSVEAEVTRTVEESSPDLVVNCAALTDVDECEEDPERAYEVNATAPGTIAKAARAVGADVVHVSTDYVFDGRSTEPYDETAETNPIQVYGETKLSGECAVRKAAPDALVPRLSFVWGIHRGSKELEGFPEWVRSKLRDAEPVSLFGDQYVTPTRAGQAAAVVLDLVEGGQAGTIHVAARSCVTPYEFGQILATTLDADRVPLRETSMADVDREAARPEYSCLDTGLVESLRDEPQPTVEEDVSAVLP